MCVCVCVCVCVKCKDRYKQEKKNKWVGVCVHMCSFQFSKGGNFH